MANCAVVNARGLSPFARAPIREGASAVELVIRFARSLPGVKELIFLTEDETAEFPGDVRSVRIAGDGTSDFLNTLIQAAGGYEHCFYLFADCPFYDQAATERMYGNHTRYYAQYTFADGYPFGITPEILRVDVLPKLATLAGEDTSPVTRGTLFDVIQKDINSFDIETDLAPKDLRMLRASLTCDTRRNALLSRQVAEAGGTDAGSIISILEQKPELLRTLPAFANIQIVDGCPQACAYCPFPVFGGDVTSNNGCMPAGDFSLIAGKIADFCDDAVLSVSLWGEPSRHPGIKEIIETAGSIDGLSLIVETAGLGWDRKMIEQLSPSALDSLSWIISLDAPDEAAYRELRGAGFTEAKDTAQYLIERFGDKVHVQAVRMTDNEAVLEGYYRYWKELTDNVIIQKYDTFAGLLPQRRVTDLSPLNRFPCWHIKRDLTVLMDGTVTMCREDVHRNHVLGNILKEDLSAIWIRGEEVYNLHTAEDYPEICTRCDEYYTYNF